MIANIAFLYTILEITELGMNIDKLSVVIENLCLTLTHVSGVVKVIEEDCL